MSVLGHLTAPLLRSGPGTRSLDDIIVDPNVPAGEAIEPGGNTSGMPALTEPTARVHASFVEAVREFCAEGRYSRLDPAELADAEQFRRYLDRLRVDAHRGVLRRHYQVPQTSLWLTDSDEFLGQLSIRHRLNRRRRYIGGNIGYSVRPSQRRRGYATLMLRLSLPVAHQLGIDPALITCDDTNVASRRVIEANGGQLASASHGILRFWSRSRLHQGRSASVAPSCCVYMDQWVSSVGLDPVEPAG